MNLRGFDFPLTPFCCINHSGSRLPSVYFPSTKAKVYENSTGTAILTYGSDLFLLVSTGARSLHCLTAISRLPELKL